MPTPSTPRQPPAPKRRIAALAASMVALTALLTNCGPATSDDTPPNTHPPTAPDATAQDHTPEPRTTEAGLTITDLIPGTGEPAPKNATVTIEFTAWIVGNEESFDSTERRRRPMAFPLDSEGLIPGLRQGIEGMRTGGTRRLEIPANLAYGTTGRHPVPPDADLLYEITLLDWQPPTR